LINFKVNLHGIGNAPSNYRNRKLLIQTSNVHDLSLQFMLTKQKWSKHWKLYAFYLKGECLLLLQPLLLKDQMNKAYAYQSLIWQDLGSRAVGR